MLTYLNSSIGKKQIIAVSGLAMVFFLIAHLLGNLLVFLGPESLNNYASKLHDLGPVLWVARIGLLSMFFLHFSLVVNLVIQNKKARVISYSTSLHKKTRSLFTQTMRVSGVVIFTYIGIHLYDFTFTAHTPDISTINGVYYGLYGHLYNYFLNPFRSVFYILAMFSIGFHLIHGVQSVLQTFGFNHSFFTPLIKKMSWVLAGVLSLGFSMIPVYVIIHNTLGWSVS
jgi:succinate dehydrogenase / fumarate reductase, cytochrome b subunit